MARFSLVFFAADLTVDICRRSSCVIRNGFEQGEEVEVKYRGDRYVGLILRIHDKQAALKPLVSEACKVIQEERLKGNDTSRKERIKNRLIDELPQPSSEEVEVSSSGRKRKSVDYRILDDPSCENNIADHPQGNKKSETRAGPMNSHAHDDDNDVALTLLQDGCSDSDHDAGQSNVACVRSSTPTNRSKKNRPAKPRPDCPSSPIWDENSPPLFDDEGLNITQLQLSTLIPAGKKHQRTQKKTKTPASTKCQSDSAVGPMSPIWHKNSPPPSDKRPKGSTCHWPACVRERRELANLKESFGKLQAEHKKLLRHTENMTAASNSIATQDHAGVCSGLVPQDVAAEQKMIELVAGSGVYLFRTQLALVKEGVKSKSALACRLIRVFFSEEQLEKGRTSPKVHGTGPFLNQIIIETVKAFASKHKDLPNGHRKGVAFALNMTCKNRAIKAALSRSADHKEEVEQQQEEMDDSDA